MNCCLLKIHGKYLLNVDSTCILFQYTGVSRKPFSVLRGHKVTEEQFSGVTGLQENPSPGSLDYRRTLLRGHRVTGEPFSGVTGLQENPSPGSLGYRITLLRGHWITGEPFSGVGGFQENQSLGSQSRNLLQSQGFMKTLFRDQGFQGREARMRGSVSRDPKD